MPIQVLSKFTQIEKIQYILIFIVNVDMTQPICNVYNFKKQKNLFFNYLSYDMVQVRFGHHFTLNSVHCFASNRCIGGYIILIGRYSF